MSIAKRKMPEECNQCVHRDGWKPYWGDDIVDKQKDAADWNLKDSGDAIAGPPSCLWYLLSWQHHYSNR